MKALVILLSLLISTSGFSKTLLINQKSARFDHLVKLLICTEDAPILCKHFSLDRDSAREEVRRLCGVVGTAEVKLSGVWSNDRLVDFKCVYGALTNSQCRAVGFDCALEGQCVKDLSLRAGVDTSSPGYRAALEDILKNPSAIFNYPHYFYLCANPR